MKKVITFLIIVTVLMTVFNLVAFAEEVPIVDVGEQEPSTSEVPEQPDTEQPSEDPTVPSDTNNENETDIPTDDVPTQDVPPETPTEENADWLTRIIEAFSNGNATEIVNMAFIVFNIIMMTLLKNGTKTSLQDMLSLFTKSDESSKFRVNKLIDVVNETLSELRNFFKKFSAGQTSMEDMVKEQMAGLKNNLSERLKEVESKVDVKTVSYEQVHAIAEGMKSINEMFLIVYQGSKTIPAATKEIIAEKSSQCTKALNAVEVKTDDSQS